MTLIKDRVEFAFHTFSKILNLKDNTVYDFGQGFKLPVKNMLPLLMIQLARDVNTHPETAEGIIDWMFDAILYMKGDADNLGKMDFVWDLNLNDASKN